MIVPGWQGRNDEPGERWHQIMQPWTAASQGGIAFTGFGCDEGVRRNQGRIGAAEGPTALRAMMSNLATTRPDLYDCGDITVKSQEFEVAQLIYADKIARSIDAGSLAIGLGGGHEIAYGSYMGLIKSERTSKEDRIGILNLDAHFDLRPGEPSSGTPFAQALELGGGNTQYLAVGISEAANGRSLFERADALGAQYVLDHELSQVPTERIQKAFDQVEHLYVSLDLDVLPASIAPGVSAPAARGVSLEVVSQILQLAAASGKLRLFDVAELNPRFDLDNRTARTASRLIWEVVKAWKSS